jgi:GxxExxY protein
MDTDRQRAGAAGREYPERDYPHQELTSKIIASSFAVFRTLGYGFLESVYRRALAVELHYCGVRIAQEVSYEIRYRGVSVGVYRADLVANSIVMVETKTGSFLDPTTPDQLLNCLSAAHLRLGLIVYFGPKGARVRRIIRSDDDRITHM